jgi:transposase-like protein
MTRPFSQAYKQKMIERLTGKDAVSARRASEETGISQETLSKWLRDARSLPLMAPRKRRTKPWSVEEKAKVLTETARLTGGELTEYLSRQGLVLGELEQWRLALDEEGRASIATTKRIRKLERELARKEKALAEAAALLVLKKKVEDLWEDEDDDTGESNES